MKTLDTTLRDGLQGVGFSLSVDERLQVAAMLDSLGIDFIEAGFPASNPQTRQFLDKLAQQDFANKIYLFGATRKPGEAAKQSPVLKTLADSPFPGAVVVGKTWPLHIKQVLGTTPEENLEMISESIDLLRASGKKVIYDAEHFFDAFREGPDYALQCLAAARHAEWITLCDTNGSSTPFQIREAVLQAMQLELPLGIHTHNDCELAVANSLEAAKAGVGLIQGTINGVGERCGNANLLSIIGNLQLKMGYQILTPQQLEQLTHVSRVVDELINQPSDPKQAYVGEHAFTHKGGMHAAGMERHRETFEHINPELVGNRSSVIVSEMSGRASLRSKAEQMRIVLADVELEERLHEIKQLEAEGYSFESAEASLYLLLTGKRLFRIADYQVDIHQSRSRAMLRLESSEAYYQGRGRGPVAAMDQALRAALTRTQGEVRHMQLTDYKVHIIDAAKGTSATTRVLLQASGFGQSWTSIGVSDNIIEASCRALEDAYNYGLDLDAKN